MEPQFYNPFCWHCIKIATYILLVLQQTALLMTWLRNAAHARSCCTHWSIAEADINFVMWYYKNQDMVIFRIHDCRYYNSNWNLDTTCSPCGLSANTCLLTSSSICLAAVYNRRAFFSLSLGELFPIHSMLEHRRHVSM